MIRRTVAGFILGPSLLVGSLAWSGFLALRTVFDADRSADVAEEMLDNEQVRDQLTENLAAAVATSVPEDGPITGDQVDQVAAALLDDPAVEELVLDAFTSAHGAFLGDGDVPRTLDLTAGADALRSALVETAPALDSSLPQSPAVRVTLPTDRIPNAGPIRDFLETSVPILAAIAIGGGLLALLTTSDRSSVLTRAGIWALSTTVFYLFLGFGVPWLLRAFAPDQAEVLAALVTALLRTTLVPSLVLALCGGGLVAAAIIWPSADRRREIEADEARERRRAQRGPAWPGPVPQPVVYPDPDWGSDRPAGPRSRAPRRPSDSTRVRSAPTPTGPTAQPATPSVPVDRPDPRASPGDRPSPARPPRPSPTAPAPLPTPDRPPPLPTASSVRKAGEPAADPASPADASPLADPSMGSSSMLPTKEQAERRSRWMPPHWVEGHGWVLDPDDPKPPPANARWVEGVGYVVPGPPPDGR